MPNPPADLEASVVTYVNMEITKRSAVIKDSSRFYEYKVIIIKKLLKNEQKLAIHGVFIYKTEKVTNINGQFWQNNQIY